MKPAVHQHGTQHFPTQNLGDTQYMPSQIRANHLQSIYRSDNLDHLAQEEATQLKPPTHPAAPAAEEHAEPTAPVEQERDSSSPKQTAVEHHDAADDDSGDDLAENTQFSTSSSAGLTNLSPTTPALAGSKRTRSGSIITPQMRTPAADLTKLFAINSAAKGKVVGLSQVFRQTQAESSPFPDGPRSDPVFGRPSPEFRNDTPTSPVGAATSSPVVTRKSAGRTSSLPPQQGGLTTAHHSTERRRAAHSTDQGSASEDSCGEGDFTQFTDEAGNVLPSSARRRKSVRRTPVVKSIYPSFRGGMRDISSDRVIDLITPARHVSHKPTSIPTFTTPLNRLSQVNEEEEEQDEDGNNEEEDANDQWDELGQTVLSSQRHQESNNDRSVQVPMSTLRRRNDDSSAPKVQASSSLDHAVRERAVSHRQADVRDDMETEDFQDQRFVLSQHDVVVDSQPAKAPTESPKPAAHLTTPSPARDEAEDDAAPSKSAAMTTAVSVPPGIDPVFGSSPPQRGGSSLADIPSTAVAEEAGETDELAGPAAASGTVFQSNTKHRLNYSIPLSSPASSEPIGLQRRTRASKDLGGGNLSASQPESSSRSSQPHRTLLRSTSASHLNYTKSRLSQSQITPDHSQAQQQMLGTEDDDTALLTKMIANGQSPDKRLDRLSSLDLRVLDAEDEESHKAVANSSENMMWNQKDRGKVYKSAKKIRPKKFSKNVFNAQIETGQVLPQPHKEHTHRLSPSPVQDLGALPSAPSSSPVRGPGRLKRPRKAQKASPVKRRRSIYDLSLSQDVSQAKPARSQKGKMSEAPSELLTGAQAQAPSSSELSALPVESHPPEQAVRNDVEDGSDAASDTRLSTLETRSARALVVTNPRRVLARFRDSQLKFYPALCTGSTPGRSDQYRVQFDDGTIDDVERHLVKTFELHEGDQVKLDLAGHKAHTYTVHGFRRTPENDKTDRAKTTKTDVFGYNIVSLVLQSRRSGTGADLASPPAEDFPLESVYLTATLWTRLTKREYLHQDEKNDLEASLLTPQGHSSHASTPSSRKRRVEQMKSSLMPELTRHIPQAKAGIFSNLVFAISYTRKEKDKDHLTKLINDNGGTILDDGFERLFDNGAEFQLTKEAQRYKAAFLIADTHSRRKKYVQALTINIPCLAGRWVDDSVGKSAIQPWQRYLLPAGHSYWLDGEVRSRSFSPDAYNAITECKHLKDMIVARPNLLLGKRVILVQNKQLTAEGGERLALVPRLRPWCRRSRTRGVESGSEDVVESDFC